ncbi:MAG: hypothetical protein DRO11_01690 [Methanobacteriota archaeon]|nr:MAG: hypothetical protein DRO11_01690 [Euryarchaeota archaeon]
MIKNLEIRNFKSIKHLELECKRVNIFIGEPNTGKSNILEAVGIFSLPHQGGLEGFVRFESMSNLFYDENLEDRIWIKADELVLKIEFKDWKFYGTCHDKEKRFFSFDYDHTGSGSSTCSIAPSAFKFYRFAVRNKFPGKESGFLLPPSGENLLAVLMTHKELKSTVSQIFAPFGLRLVFKPQEDKIEVLKQFEDVLISFPYSLASETLQRIIFYLTAVNSNKNSILVFEEPEAHAFPYYTKFIAEKIALDKNNNQYFISTHNPYFLLSILEKSPRDDINIFITYFEDYRTKVKLLTKSDLEEIMKMGIDVFFNMERFLGDG